MTTSTAGARGLTLTGTGVAGGVVGGAVGGMVFGMMMQMMNRMPMIAQLVGSNSAAVAWVVHLMISMVLGAGFAIVLGSSASSTASALGLGAAYGMVWWVLGGLLLMPSKLGMPVFHFDAMAWQSLMGHMIFGLLLGFVYHRIVRSATS